MTIPIEPVAIPAVVTRIAAGRPVYATWANEIGGLTFQVVPDDERLDYYLRLWEAGE